VRVRVHVPTWPSLGKDDLTSETTDALIPRPQSGQVVEEETSLGIAAGFHHGVLEVDTLGVRFLATHLTPRSAAARVKECELIASRCRELDRLGVPVVLLGDLNTLSPLDERAYEKQGSVFVSQTPNSFTLQCPAPAQARALIRENISEAINSTL
jgi:hypothetical protein